MTKPSRVTTKRIMLGEFEVYLDGDKTEYTIHNGSRGLSGRDTVNTYAICNQRTGKITVLGPLNTCKKAVEFTLLKKAAMPASIPAPKVVF